MFGAHRSDRKLGPVSTARKTVTILFYDVTGSTALGEALDPESLREVIRRYFTEMSAVIERHTGTVEKFTGDAVMSVFGVPQIHEDDALRAVRAAIDMQSALDGLNVEIERGWGTRIRANGRGGRSAQECVHRPAIPPIPRRGG